MSLAYKRCNYDKEEKSLSFQEGFTCCVPGCYNNSKRNKELSFYRIPKDELQRKIWLHKISRKNFVPTDGHRVCSSHFTGGRKTYLHNVPTIVPKTIQPQQTRPRTSNTSNGKRKYIFPVDQSKLGKVDDLEIENGQKILMETLTMMQKSFVQNVHAIAMKKFSNLKITLIRLKLETKGT